jgi:hypothetical protein
MFLDAWNSERCRVLRFVPQKKRKKKPTLRICTRCKDDFVPAERKRFPSSRRLGLNWRRGRGHLTTSQGLNNSKVSWSLKPGTHAFDRFSLEVCQKTWKSIQGRIWQQTYQFYHTRLDKRPSRTLSQIFCFRTAF